MAELVCSNSFKSIDPKSAIGILKEELKKENFILVNCVYKTAIPAGKALAVDRIKFSKLITEILRNNPNIKIIRKEVKNT